MLTASAQEDTLTIHVGVFDPLFEPDISNRDVALAAGAAAVGFSFFMLYVLHIMDQKRKEAKK